MDRIAKWNSRYASSAEWTHGADAPPSQIVPEAVDGVEPGLALDLACGAGRHAVFLAERGWRVVAVDGSSVGVDLLREKAGRRGVLDAIDARVADLESRPRGFEIEPDRYDLVCDLYYLDRTLFDDIRAGVRPGGLFVAAIHTADPAAEEPMNPDFLLEPGELRSIVESWGWEILHWRGGESRDGGHHRPTDEIVARRPAARRPA